MRRLFTGMPRATAVATTLSGFDVLIQPSKRKKRQYRLGSFFKKNRYICDEGTESEIHLKRGSRWQQSKLVEMN
jgi:hypothetical protein